jgi:hypothetical protein
VLTDTDPAAQVVLIGEDDNVPQVLLDAANNAVALSARTPPRTIESRCMSPEVAHRVISHSIRTWSEADINWQAKPADSIENENSRRRRHDGFVSKRRDRPYQAVRSKHWVKVKNRKHPAMESRDGVFRLTRRRCR